jgi:excisionase family DNA binding protein
LPADAVIPVPGKWVRELCGEPPTSTIVNAETVPPPDLTVKEVAMRFGRQPSTVRLWCERGKFSGAYRLHGREWRIPVAALAQFEADARSGVTKVAPSQLRAGSRSAPRLSDWRKAS